MRRVCVLAALAVLVLSTRSAARHLVVVRLTHEPLGVLVRESRTIHVLRVESVGKDGATFRAEAALKGKLGEAPFRFAELGEEVRQEGAFRPGALVLCFRQDGCATLFVGGRWALAAEPLDWRGEKHWFCCEAARSSPTFAGTAEVLREHVVAVLAGRETTLTARAPQRWGQVGGPRLWRIKASLKITDSVLSDESPHFVGWGSGAPDEVMKLARALRAAAPEDRIAAANDLAHLGPAARPALPALRLAARGPDPNVCLAAATTLARLVPGDDRPITAIQALLCHADFKVRFAAAVALADLGPQALPALPALLRALQDRTEVAVVRAAATAAVGRVAPGSASQREAVTALASLVKTDLSPDVRAEAVGALRRFGPHACEAAPTLRKGLAALAVGPGQFDAEAVALLARLSPPPVELLGEVLEDRRAPDSARRAAARQLGALGPRARRALPSLRKTFGEPPEFAGRDPGSFWLVVAAAFLAVDRAAAPGQVAPVLVGLAKQGDHNREPAVRLLGKCGTAARPSLPMLIPALAWTGARPLTPDTLRCLTPLLGPEEDRFAEKLERLCGRRSEAVELAEVLCRLGHTKEGLEQAARCLNRYRAERRSAAARWLGERGTEARAVEPALRQALGRATGAERARLALTLWRARGSPGTAAQGRAFTALGDLLALCEGEAPAVGPIPPDVFWVWPDTGLAWWQEDGAVGAAVALLHGRLEARGDPVPILALALRDQSPHVRLAAAVALARAEPRHPETITALLRLLERQPHFFGYAADTLAALGPCAAPVAPLLLPYLRHPDEKVYRATDRVLRRITPEAAARAWGAAGVPGAVPEDLGPLWDDLAGADSLRADLAVWRLAGAGPRAVALLRERLRPPQALPSKRLAGLIKELDGDDFATRQQAEAELGKALESASPALRRARPGASLELRLRIDRLLASLDPPKEPERRRRLRALRLLEEMGSPDARALLKGLARGAPGLGPPWEEAGAALRRLERP
jgi:hypothetical protein